MNGEYVEVFKNVVTNYFKTLSYSSPTIIEKKKKTSVDSLPRSKPHSSQIQTQTIITTTTYLVACLAHAIW